MPQAVPAKTALEKKRANICDDSLTALLLPCSCRVFLNCGDFPTKMSGIQLPKCSCTVLFQGAESYGSP